MASWGGSCEYGVGCGGFGAVLVVPGRFWWPRGGSSGRLMRVWGGLWGLWGGSGGRGVAPQGRSLGRLSGAVHWGGPWGHGGGSGGGPGSVPVRFRCSHLGQLPEAGLQCGQEDAADGHVVPGLRQARVLTQQLHRQAAREVTHRDLVRLRGGTGSAGGCGVSGGLWGQRGAVGSARGCGVSAGSAGGLQDYGVSMGSAKELWRLWNEYEVSKGAVGVMESRRGQ